MKHSTARKFVSVTPPAAIVDNAAFTTAAVDTKGWKQVTFIVFLGALDIAIASAKVRHSDSSDMSNSSDLSTGGTDFTLPIATDDNTVLQFNVDMRGRKRYVDLEITGGDGATGTFLSVIAELSRGETTPASAAGRGLSLDVNV
jgi:hypothetical protein